MTVLEAGSHGLPVVATRSGGHPEMVQDGVTGLLVPPDDPKALAQALERLLDESLRASLGERARRHISSNFTVKAMAEKYVAAIEFVRRARYATDPATAAHTLTRSGRRRPPAPRR